MRESLSPTEAAETEKHVFQRSWGCSGELQRKYRHPDAGYGSEQQRRGSGDIAGKATGDNRGIGRIPEIVRSYIKASVRHGQTECGGKVQTAGERETVPHSCVVYKSSSPRRLHGRRDMASLDRRPFSGRYLGTERSPELRGGSGERSGRRDSRVGDHGNQFSEITRMRR